MSSISGKTLRSVDLTVLLIDFDLNKSESFEML